MQINYVGAAIDHAAALGFRSLLLVGHFGKLAKVAAGTMNTHSRTADGRAETLAAHTALCGGSRALTERIFACAATDGAVELLEAAGLRERVMSSIAAALDRQLKHRAGEGMEIDLVVRLVQAFQAQQLFGGRGHQGGKARILIQNVSDVHHLRVFELGHAPLYNGFTGKSETLFARAAGTQS